MTWQHNAANSANLRALNVAVSQGFVSHRALVALAATCSAMRSSSRGPRQPRRSPHRKGKQQQQLVTSREASVGLLAWPPSELGLLLEPTPQQQGEEGAQGEGPSAQLKEFLQQLAREEKPSEGQYNILMADLCRSGRFDPAWRAYCAAKEGGLGLRYNGCARLVGLAVKAGDLRAAVEVFEDLKAGGAAPNKVTYCSLISALGKDKRRGVRSAQLAYELWRELLDQRAGEALDAAAYRIGMNACVGVGRLSEAQALLRQVAAAGEAQDPRAYNILLKHYSRAGDTKALQALLSHMRTSGVAPSAVSYNILIDAYARDGAIEEARREMERAVVAGVRLDAWSYTSLVRGYVDAGDMPAAERLLKDMAAAGVSPNAVTYSHLVEGYVRSRDLQAAAATLRAMEAAGQAPNAVAYNTLLRGYVSELGGDGDDSGGLQQVLELLETMAARGVAPTTDTFNTLMAAAVAGRQAQLALGLYERMVAAGLRPDTLTYTILLQAYSRTDRVGEAMATFEALCSDPNAVLDVPAYNAATDVLSRAGEMDAAKRMAEAALRLSKKQGQPPPMEAFGALVMGYARLREAKLALDVVRRYHAEGGQPDERMLEALADVSLRAGEYKVAMQSVRALELMGKPVVKSRYRGLVVAAMRRQERAAAGGGAGGSRDSSNGSRDGEGEGTEGGRSRRGGATAARNVYLERFKFWLGLPNTYYNSGPDEDEEVD